MSGLRGPDSSKDAQLLDNAVFPETVDVNIRQLAKSRVFQYGSVPTATR